MSNMLPRRFGVEIEYNSFDKSSRSVDANNLPNGIYFFADTIKYKLNKNVDIHKWEHTNNNSNWVVKPDSSCGLEVCSPPVNAHYGFKEIYDVIECLAKTKHISADNRCSLHVHVEIEDFNQEEITTLVTRWINFEMFFYFITRTNRWMNKYCKPLGFYHFFNNTKNINITKAIDVLSDNKYFAINFYHYKKGKRKTIEFRIMGSDACLDPNDALNWCKVILLFVDACRKRSDNYTMIYNPKYLSVKEITNFIDFQNEKELCMWIVSRLSDTMKSDLATMFVWKNMVENCKNDINELMDKLQGVACD